ncbi:hypothetical protein NF212_07970 [Parasalinivibrio latis]|uniref:hypothetical protein n=1 Tax=Parasalinivibrio latis TaxID=2952610 RepID=UPI0030E339CD
MDVKLKVLCRLEPGCLGPNGINHIEAFCGVAQKPIQSLLGDRIEWELTPRYDKSEPEFDYVLANRLLTESQAEKYLSSLELTPEDVEEMFNERLTGYITQFMERV